MKSCETLAVGHSPSAVEVSDTNANKVECFIHALEGNALCVHGVCAWTLECIMNNLQANISTELIQPHSTIRISYIVVATIRKHHLPIRAHTQQKGLFKLDYHLIGVLIRITSCLCMYRAVCMHVQTCAHPSGIGYLLIVRVLWS